MSRLTRIVIPSLPHHITQRGNRRQNTFFSDTDYRIYLRVMASWCAKYRVEIWCYCLMPNHVHLIAVPEIEKSLGRAIGEAHRRYTCNVNEKKRWKGYLWQGRFSSFPLDESHLLTAARYIELNPLQGGLVSAPARYPWSSCSAHLKGTDDLLVKTKPLLRLVDNWKEFLYQGISKEDLKKIEKHERTGRPLGSESFIEKLEKITSRTLKKRSLAQN